MYSAAVEIQAERLAKRQQQNRYSTSLIDNNAQDSVLSLSSVFKSHCQHMMVGYRDTSYSWGGKGRFQLRHPSPAPENAAGIGCPFPNGPAIASRTGEADELGLCKPERIMRCFKLKTVRRV
jgi:hypothetical protein